jgi:predicted porin
MKKIALALLVAATCGLAQAQSNVTIYGIMDVGVVNTTSVGTNNGSATQLISGALNTSRIGFKGEEKLGGSLSSGFVLEGQINPGDGSQGTVSGTGATNGLFSRSANVFVKDDSLGTVRLGRQGNLGFEAFNYGDTNAGKNFGGSILFWNDGSSFGGTTTAKTGIGTMTGTTFVSNAIRYDSRDFNGFRVSGQYVLPGTSSTNTLGNLDASSRYITAVTYNKGPWAAAGSFMSTNDSTGDTQYQVTTLGGNYTLPAGHKIAAGYHTFQNKASSATSNNNFNLMETTGRYKVDSRNSVHVGYYKLGDKTNAANGAQMGSLIGTHELSKTTSVYAGVARMNNNGASGFAAYGAGGANLNTLQSTTSLPASMQSSGLTQTAITTGLTVLF